MKSNSEPVVVIVRIPTPRFAPKWLVRRKMRETIGLYRSIPGLAYKIFTIESQRRMRRAYRSNLVRLDFRITKPNRDNRLGATIVCSQ